MSKEIVMLLLFLGVAANAFVPVIAPGQMIAFLFSNLALTAFLTKLREIREKPTRAFLIILAGLSSFWLTGAALVQADISADPLPLFVFAFSTVQTCLVAYTLSASEGVIFGATGFALVAGAFNFGRAPLPIFDMALDRLLVIAVITSLSESLWAWLVGNSEGLKSSLISVGKASLVASAMNFFSFYVQYGSFSESSGVTWFYLLAHAVLVSLFVLLHEFVTSTYSIRRVVTEAGAKYRRKLRMEEAISEEEEMTDPFEDLIAEMEKFKESPPSNKLAATQTIARFRNEFRVLSSRYDTPSKKKAEKLLEGLG